MTWNYRRRIKIIPGVHLNLSKSGISTSIGVKGASVNVSKNGTYLNSSIPGTGLYSRIKLSNNSSYATDTLEDETPRPEPVHSSHTPVDNIFSADPQKITSQNMEGVKEAILAAQQQRLELASDLRDVKKALSRSKSKLTMSYVLLYGFLNKSVSRRIKQDMGNQRETIDQIEEQISDSAVLLDYVFDDEILKRYTLVAESFKKMAASNKVWDVTSTYDQDRVATRSAASVVVSRKEVQFGMKSIPDIKSNFTPLYFQNGNGADLYFYPHFVIVYANKEKFAIIELQELVMDFTSTRFVESSPVPPDSKIIDRTWAKVNKNGTPDKRFKDNYEIPVLRYGNIAIKTTTGLNEQYEFSNYEACEAFAGAFLTYQNLVKGMGEC